MSIQEQPSPASVAAGGNPGTADGSPREGTDREAETDDGAGTEEGAEPASGRGGGEDPTAELKRLRSEFAKRDEELAQARDTIASIESDPEIMAFLTNRASGRQTQAEDPVERVIAKNWPEIQEVDGQRVRNPSTPAIRELAQAIREGLREELRAEFEPKLRSVDKTVAGTRFDRAISEGGIDFETARSPEFKAFAKEMRGAKSFRVLQEKQPEDAADWLVAKWTARNRGRVENQAQRERVELAKGARLNGTSARGGPTAPKKFEYDPGDPDFMVKRSEFLRNGGRLEDLVRKR